MAGENRISNEVQNAIEGNWLMFFDWPLPSDLPPGDEHYQHAKFVAVGRRWVTGPPSDQILNDVTVCGVSWLGGWDRPPDNYGHLNIETLDFDVAPRLNNEASHVTRIRLRLRGATMSGGFIEGYNPLTAERVDWTKVIPSNDGASPVVYGVFQSTLAMDAFGRLVSIEEESDFDPDQLIVGFRLSNELRNQLIGPHLQGSTVVPGDCCWAKAALRDGRRHAKVVMERVTDNYKCEAIMAVLTAINCKYWPVHFE